MKQYEKAYIYFRKLALSLEYGFWRIEVEL